MPTQDRADPSLDLTPPGEGVPDGPRLDFLAALCDGTRCTRDAHMVLADDDEMGYGVWIAGSPFTIRHGFVDGGDGLGDGYDVSVFVRRGSGPQTGAFRLGTTFVFQSDRTVTVTTDKCGPGYWEQTEPVTCRWFVHDFPDGLPPGRYEIWVVWQAPCSAWIELGATGTCADPSEPIAGFWSLVDMPFYSADYFEDFPRPPRSIRDLEAEPITRGL